MKFIRTGMKLIKIIINSLFFELKGFLPDFFEPFSGFFRLFWDFLDFFRLLILILILIEI